jgi:hypothetical protein
MEPVVVWNVQEHINEHLMVIDMDMGWSGSWGMWRGAYDFLQS